jgi:hypothetical protein
VSSKGPISDDAEKGGPAVSTALVVGLGEVGVRAARQLLDTPGVARVLVAGESAPRARDVARALHDGAEAFELTSASDLSGIDVVVGAVPADAEQALARRAIDARVPYASAVDDLDALESVRGLDAVARAQGVSVLVGCGLAPGLGDVLVRHATGVLDAVDEVHVARFGVAGEASAAAARRAVRAPALEWRDGELVHDPRHAAELVWFPDPLGERECTLVATGVRMLAETAPGVSRASARLGLATGRRLALSPRHDVGDEWAAVRAEAWGWNGTTRSTVVYGVIERAAVAAGTVLGVAAAGLAGVVPVLSTSEAGVRGLGSAVDPVPFLAELARRGVKAATFEGVAV